LSTRIIVSGRTIEIAWWGTRSSAAPIVLLHEGLGSVGTWRDFPEALAMRTRRAVMAYSRCGHGASDPPATRRGIAFTEEEAALLPTVLDECGIERALLYGHSDGGSIAIAAAAASPQRFPALVLQAAHVFVEDVSVASVERTKAAFVETNLRERLARYHQHVDLMFAGWTDVWLDPAFRRWNLEHYLPHITCPVLIVQGAEDEYGTERQVEAIARGLRGPVRRLILAACGHRPHRDQRERVLDVVGAFIDDHSTA
jgi:pimeloyl-ACP methyl ester carboxylesterase